MSLSGKQKKLSDVRKRLYERGKKEIKRERFQLPQVEDEVPTEWINQPNPKEDLESEDSLVSNPVDTMAKSKRKKFRIRMLFIGGLFFVLALLISSSLLFLGNNVISGDNINLSVSGPFTIGGGEEMMVQIGIQNSNRVPIESATLIVEYERGTKSADEEQRDLFIERTSLESIGVNESISVPQTVIVYGEENTEQEVKVSIEYRVEGSNALFFKEAEPLRYKISSAPVVAIVESTDKVSVGQEASVTLKVASNSGETIKNVLVRADYPNQWDFTSSSPETYAGKNVWFIKSLDPGEVVEIEVTGLVVGHVDEEAVMAFSVGVPDKNDDTKVGSIFSTAQVEWEVETSFLEVSLDIGANNDNVRVVEEGESVSGQVVLQNNLSEVVYDVEVTLNLSGSAYHSNIVQSTNGFFDSNQNSITWSPADDNSLQEIDPGDKVRLNFSLLPNSSVSTPEVRLNVDVNAKRVSDSRVPESLSLNTEGVIRVSGEASILAEARHLKGALPPKVGDTTKYKISFMVDNQANNLDNTTVVAVLPANVTWTGETGGVGSFSYNSSDRVVTWNVGSVRSGTNPIGTFNVTLLPSASDAGTTPILVREQRLKATDSFTGTTVRGLNSFVSAELSSEAGYSPGNGRVIE